MEYIHWSCEGRTDCRQPWNSGKQCKNDGEAGRVSLVVLVIYRIIGTSRASARRGEGGGGGGGHTSQPQVADSGIGSFQEVFDKDSVPTAHWSIVPGCTRYFSRNWLVFECFFLLNLSSSCWHTYFKPWNENLHWNYCSGGNNDSLLFPTKTG